ncbi:MAG: ATP-binding protein [Patescibacteria group bacterium]
MTILSNSELYRFSPWLASASLIGEDSKIVAFEDQKYRYFHPLLKSFPVGQEGIIILRGPRRVGKTTLAKLLIKQLLIEQKIPKEAVIYYSLDQVADYKELYQLVTDILDYCRERTNAHIYLFLDEISFVKEWQRAVKQLADLNLLVKTTLFLTGSSAVDLLFSSEQLPQRRGKIYPADFEFSSLSFREFARLVDPRLTRSEFSPNKLPQYRKLLSDYLLCGGFPGIINEYYQTGTIADIYYDNFAKWIEGDIYKIGRHPQTAFRLFAEIAKRETTPVSLYELSKETDLASHATVSDYLTILDKMFLIYTARYFNLDQKKPDFKKNRKIYFLDPFIRNVVLAKNAASIDGAFEFSKKIIEENRPALVEEVTGASLWRKNNNLFYGRTGEKEVDFVSKDKLFEVKYQNKVTPGEFNYLNPALRKNLTVLSKANFDDKNKIFPAEFFLAGFTP